jgi:serine/threonine-protein kinase HipA
MANELAVWLYGDLVATIERVRGRPRLTYTQTALDRYSLGTPLLSLSLPVETRQFLQGIVSPFLDGLLPEAESRKSIARDFHLLESDTFGLVTALGRDCAGAIVIQPLDDEPPLHHSTNTAEKLSESELEEIVRNLRSAPLGAGGRVRVSLAGVQEKVVLTKKMDGSWGRPIDGTPSTHILKPEIARYPNTVENEAFCMRFAQHLGLNVANVQTTQFAQRKIIVVERYDRIVHNDGSVERIHQEDFCQATGTAPDKKYQEDGGPSLSRIAGILSAMAGPNALEALFQAMTVNVIVGNGDAHGKNFSLLHLPTGEARLSPAYDVMSTLVYGDDRLAMYIDDVRRTEQVNRDRLLNEAASWGLRRARAAELLDSLRARAEEAMEDAAAQTPGVPAEILRIVRSQLMNLESH